MVGRDGVEYDAFENPALLRVGDNETASADVVSCCGRMGSVSIGKWCTRTPRASSASASDQPGSPGREGDRVASRKALA